jgi:hypothetical protein
VRWFYRMLHHSSSAARRFVARLISPATRSDAKPDASSTTRRVDQGSGEHARCEGVMFARSIHNVTIHRATTDDPLGRVVCGAQPRWSAWRGQDFWKFYSEIPTSEGAWASTPPDELLCKLCFRTKKE